MSSRPLAGWSAGVLLYSAGILFFSVNDALGKWLVGDYGVAELMFLRSLGALLLLAPVILFTGTDLRLRGQWLPHLARVACSTFDTFAFYYSVRQLPLADAMTFYLAAPLLIVAISAAVLRERVGYKKWGAALLGFAGVLIALNPGGEAMSASAVIALAGAAMFACTVTITRRLRDVPWLTLVTYQFIGSGLVGAVVSPFNWTTPPAGDLGLMFVVGIVSMGCFVCLTKALSLATASLLAPFQYMSIVWAALMGWMVWGDIPSTGIVLGAAVIIISGLLVLSPERRVAPA